MIKNDSSLISKNSNFEIYAPKLGLIYSENKKEIQKNIKNNLKNIIQDYDKKNITKEIKNSSEFRESFENIIFFIKKYIKDNNNLDIYTLSSVVAILRLEQAAKSKTTLK